LLRFLMPPVTAFQCYTGYISYLPLNFCQKNKKFFPPPYKHRPAKTLQRFRSSVVVNKDVAFVAPLQR